MIEGSEEEEKAKLTASNILREKLISEDPEIQALRESGMIPEHALKVLISLKHGLKDSKKSYKETRVYEEIVESQISQQISEAVKEENDTVLRQAVGVPQQDNSINMIQRIHKLEDLITIQGRTFIFSGDPDTGKTNLALLMAEIWQRKTNGKIITNMESVEKGKTISKWSEWKKEFSKDSKRILGIVEDGSKHMSGYKVDREKIEKEYRPFSINLAKNNGNMFILGHTGKDIHPDIRRKSYLINKPSKKTAEIYEQVNDGKGSNQLLKLSGIPKTSITYDSSEKTRFEWGNNEKKDARIPEEKEIEKQALKKLKQTSQVSTTDITGFSTKKVAEVLRELNDKLDGTQIDTTSPITLKKRRF